MIVTKTIPVYELRGCSFGYRNQRCLSNLELSLAAGRLYGLIGPNGSGKTTLINLLAGSHRPGSGEIRLLGERLEHYSRNAAARVFSLVPQNFSMEFEYSVFEVVLMGRHPYIPRFASPTVADIAMVDAALATLDITHLRERHVTRLSGGERQRVLVARALAQNTPVMLLDEATASLDVRHSIDIMRALRRRVETDGATVVAAIHDLDLAAAFCDELIVLSRGVVRAAGTTDRVLTRELLRDIFGVEALVTRPGNDSTPHIQYQYDSVA